MTEYTPESSCCYSVYSVVSPLSAAEQAAVPMITTTTCPTAVTPLTAAEQAAVPMITTTACQIGTVTFFIQTFFIRDKVYT
jgi:hypothetical protein